MWCVFRYAQRIISTQGGFVKKKLLPGVYGASNNGPLILLFSPRERVRDILTVGLVQCNFQVIQANTPFLASIKASQMLPKLVIADLSCENPKDVLLIERLQKSGRTRQIAILLITARVVDGMIQKITAEMMDQVSDGEKGRIMTMSYPFAFSDILDKINLLVSTNESLRVEEQTAR